MAKLWENVSNGFCALVGYDVISVYNAYHSNHLNNMVYEDEYNIIRARSVTTFQGVIAESRFNADDV